MADRTTVTRNDQTSRYEIHVGEAVGGYAQFLTSPRGRVIMTHTEVDPSFAGQGLGSILVGDALADLARRGEVVEPRCPFVVRYLKNNEVAGLIVDWPDDDDAPGEQSS